MGFFDERESEGREIAKIWLPAFACGAGFAKNPLAREAPGSIGSVDISFTRFAPESGRADIAHHCTRRARCGENPVFILCRLLRFTGSEVDLVRYPIVEAPMNAGRGKNGNRS